MFNARVVALLLLTVSIVLPSCGAVPLPTVIERKELQLNGGKGLVLSVREPVTTEQIQSLVDANRLDVNSTLYYMVRVFTFAAGAVPGKTNPTTRYDWTIADGLKQTARY